jgi:ammonium transporter
MVSAAPFWHISCFLAARRCSAHNLSSVAVCAPAARHLGEGGFSVNRLLLVLLVFFLGLGFLGAAEPEPAAKPDPAKTPAMLKDVSEMGDSANERGDIAWMLTSSALVLFMVPGLALFYGGMVRRKNVLATMMQSMVALAVVGVYWIAIGYCLAFGETQGGWIGWSPDKLAFLRGVNPGDKLPGTNIPIYLHVMFQGMFAIITPALISGALAERIRFGPYCLFIMLWVTFVYCPLAHWVWAMNWWDTVDAGKNMVGFLGKPATGAEAGALDFAGGTVVHIAAGLSGLACILMLRKRLGYPEHAFHPNSMVLTLLGAGLLWFGWFGFNGGSALGAGIDKTNALAVSAFSATQAAAAAAALSWMVAEWLHKGKPTALGWASGVVAGLVAVTPASGFVPMWAGLAIGAIAGVICYVAVCLKPVFKYDDSLDAFGVHGVGGFLGAVLTGVFCSKIVNSGGADGLIYGSSAQVIIQLKAAAISVVFAFAVTAVLAKAIDIVFGFITDGKSETEGLDRTEHGEVGFDLGLALEQTTQLGHEPRAANVPPNGRKGFAVVLEGTTNGQLMEAWSKLCQAGPKPPSPEFKAVYPYMTLVEGNRFYFKGGDPKAIRENIRTLFENQGFAVKAHIE